MRRTLALLAASLLAAGALAACGDDGDSAEDAEPASTTTAAAPAGTGDTKVEIKAAGTAFSPTALLAPAGKLTFAVSNGDGITHNLTVAGLGVNKDVDGGSSTEATATAKAGKYEFQCAFHPSAMKGTITVS